MRTIGIPGIGPANWGEHICVFFRNKEDLLRLAVPFMRAGLRDHEVCLWITNPVTENEALIALGNALPDLITYIDRRQFQTVPYAEWYLANGALNVAQALGQAKSRLTEAQEHGFSGLRVVGNPPTSDWSALHRYEAAVQKAMWGQPIMSLCTYPDHLSTQREMLPVITAHSAGLFPNDGYWESIPLSAA